MTQSFDETLGKLREVHNIDRREQCTIVSANGGCAFVTDPANPHLGGNLEGGDPGTRYDRCVWPWALERFSPSSMLDVGCAEGYVVRWFKDHQVDSFGVDGLPFNVECARRSQISAAVHDLTTGPYVHPTPLDLIWCCDVMEHIAEEFLPNVMATFQQAPVVLLTTGTDLHAAEGWHHVTNKPESFWVAWMKRGGFELDKDATTEARGRCEGGWFKHLGHVFIRAKSQTAPFEPTTGRGTAA